MKTFLVTVLGTCDGFEFERGGDAVKQPIEADSMYGSDFYRRVSSEVLLVEGLVPSVSGIVANPTAGLQVLAFTWRGTAESVVVAVEEVREPIKLRGTGAAFMKGSRS